MKISLIAAVSKNGAIGKDGQLPWNMPDDLKFFREYTMGKILIMGARTADSLGAPLRGRINIVVTHNPLPYLYKGFCAHTSLESALEYAKNCIAVYTNKETSLSARFENLSLESDEVMCIGGATLYEALLPKAEKLILSRIPIVVEDADTFFPFISECEWETTNTKQLESFAVEFFTRVQGT